ncbi:TetR/AcrR family transcriptional regulator [Microtetraspora fusca]|uniref:TetR/AcrR family transcriptional regulator n=1 Tax=Microtetraspora fusca TaxID=1997 RepID=A0ABW6UZA5_MICFU
MRSEPGGRSRLTKSGIVATARAIADAEGIDALTLRRLAHELGTGQSSLYRHVADRRELLQLLCDDLAESFPIAPPCSTPASWLRTHWALTYDFLAEHPWAAQVIASGEILAGGGEDTPRRVAEVLVAAGLAVDDADRAVRALWNLVLGHLLNAHPFGHLDGGPPLIDCRADYLWALDALLSGILRPGGAAAAGGGGQHG